MKFTDYLNLKKPEGQDAYSVEDFNANADALDGKLRAVDEKSADVTREELACLSGVQSNIQKQFGALKKWLLLTQMEQYFVHPEEYQSMDDGFVFVMYKESANLLSLSIYREKELTADEYGAIDLGQVTETYRPFYEAFGSGCCLIDETGYAHVTLYIDDYGNIKALLPPGHANATVYGLRVSVLYPYGTFEDMMPERERLEAEKL